MLKLDKELKFVILPFDFMAESPIYILGRKALEVVADNEVIDSVFDSLKGLMLR